MSYHISNFGQFGCRMQKYADIDGYVPETGDEFPSFRYDGFWEPHGMSSRHWLINDFQQ